MPVAETATICSSSTTAADGLRSGSARQTTRASNDSSRLRRPTRVTVADTSSTSPAITGADYERGERPPDRAPVVATAVDACPVPAGRAAQVKG